MHRFTTTTPPLLSVEFQAGDIDIDTYDGTETTVELTGSGAAAEELIADTVIEQRGDTVAVLVPKRNSGLFNRTPHLQLRVTAPHGTRLGIQAASADVTAPGRHGVVRVETGSGDVDLGEADGGRLRTGSGEVSVRLATDDIELQSGSGDIEVERTAAAATLQSGSGDLRLRSAGGPAKLQTGSGEIVVDDAQDDVRAQTGSGDVHLARVRRGVAKVTGATSDVHIGIAQGTAAWLDLHTLTGQVDSMLESGEAPGDDEEQIRIQVNTVSGDIALVRA